MAVTFTLRHVVLGVLVTSLWHMTLTQTLQQVIDLRATNVDEPATYHKAIRPVASQNESVKVEMYLFLRGMGGLDEKAQTMDTLVELQFFWYNENFWWTPSDYGGLYGMELIQDEVWVADLIVGNSAEAFTTFGHKNMKTWQLACGKSNWKIRSAITSNCDIDISYYPFDTQICDIEFVPEFMYPNEQRIYVFNSYLHTTPIVDMSELDRDGTWDIIDTAVSDEYEDDSTKQTLKYTFLLQRKTTYFILSLILPVFFLSFTATLVFALPVDAGEKMGTSITVLLSFAVYLTIVTDYLPDTSLHISLLGLYLVLLFGLCTVCVILTTFVIRINFKPETDKIGKKTRTFSIFARKRGYSFNVFWLIKVQCEQKKGNPEDNGGAEYGRRPNYLKEKTAVKIIAPIETEEPTTLKRINSDMVITAAVPEVEEVVTWPDVARALDWAAFLFTTTLNLLTTFLFFLILMIGSAVNKPAIDPVTFTSNLDFNSIVPNPYTLGIYILC